MKMRRMSAKQQNVCQPSNARWCDTLELSWDSESRQSKQDWRAILRDFVAATTPADYRWTLPNRRYIAAGLYLPSVFREGVGTIVIGVDTSGSIGTHELEQFAGEISAIAEEAQPEIIHVVYCDAAVQFCYPNRTELLRTTRIRCHCSIPLTRPILRSWLFRTV
jgi:predicted metal-dependent peptidase